MAQVTVSLNGREYTVGCGPGEETRIRELARSIDSRMRKFGQQAGQIGEARLLVMMLLTMADELSEARSGASGHGPQGFAEGLTALAKRIDTVAERLEAAKI
jgi:cell division protein ZapA